MYLLLGYIRASLPPGFPLLHACRALAYTYVITRIQHCNPVSAGTDGTILCLSYLASLPSCVTIEECQMSGFNTEKLLTITCISIHLTNLFFVLFQHTSCSQLRYMTFCLLELGCKDSVCMGWCSQRARCSRLCWYLQLDKLFQSSPALTAAYVSFPSGISSPTRCCC